MNKLATLLIGLLIGFSTNAIAADYEVIGSGSSEVNGYYDEVGTYTTYKTDGQYSGQPMPLYRKLGTNYYMGYRGCATKWIIVELPDGPDGGPNSNWSDVGGGPGTGHIYGHYTDAATPPATGWVVKHTSPSPAPTVNVAAPPAPNPMTWLTVPYETSTSAISMTATTVSDPSGPVQYFFDYYTSPTGGSGGSDSTWQTSTSYTDSGLSANHQYSYRVRARDAHNQMNNYSTVSYDYTDIETPSGISFSTITTTSIRVQSSNTPSGLDRGSSGLILYNVTAGTNSGWQQNNNYWISGSLAVNTQYGFRARARNGDANATPYSSIYYRYTLANTPGAAAFSNVTLTGIRANWTANGNPAGTLYYCENTTAGTNSGWTTNTYWTSSGLTCGTTYAFRVRACNGNGVETGWTTLGSQTTANCADTTPPTPNPMTWSTEPYENGPTSIAMSATTASDPSGPVEYEFDFTSSPTGGNGGSDSGWQAGTTYTDTGLSPNHQYGYRVRARDTADNMTAYSAISYDYTLANTPGVAVFSDVAETSVGVNWTANSNPAGTQYYCENTTDGTNSGWTANTSWTSSGLTCETPYAFQVKARNGDGLETARVSLGSQTTGDCANHPPQTPVLIWPPDNESGIPLTPELQTGAFDDEDIDDTHAATLWQISTDSNFTFHVLDLTSDTQLTSLPVPELMLTADTDYFWRVRYYDNNAGESEWSLTRKFTTLEAIDTDDPDGDGIPDQQAVTDPTLDLDGDGIPDITQSDIRCVNSVVGNAQIGVSIKNAPNVSAIESIRSIDPSHITAPPGAAQNLPFGLLAFKLMVDNLGDPATVEVFYSDPLPIDVRWLKQDSLHGWQDHTNHVTFSVDRRSVLLDLRDGGIGDCDETENYAIIDPSGPSVFVSSGTPPADDGGGGGCFIATAAYGSALEPHVEILRNFRDRFLLNGRLGKCLVSLYNAHSPSVAKVISRHSSMRAAIRLFLLPLVGFSWIALKLGLLLTAAILLLICLVAGTVVSAFVRRKCRPT